MELQLVLKACIQEGCWTALPKGADALGNPEFDQRGLVELETHEPQRASTRMLLDVARIKAARSCDQLDATAGSAMIVNP